MILDPTNTSIDMIELSMIINPHRFEEDVKPYIDSFGYDLKLEYWDSFKWDRYRHNWLWKNEDYTIYFAYKSNTGNGDSENKFRIKWNPNKVDPEDKILLILLNVFKYVKGNPIVEWFDVAFDYEGITTSDLILDKGRKRRWSQHNFANGSDFTYYMGNSGSNGSIKVYDKATEEQKGKANYNKTRYEVTIRDAVVVKDYIEWKCTTTLCKMYLRGIQGLYVDKGLSPTEKLLIHSVETGFGMSELTYEQRKRYEKIALSRSELHTKIEPTQLDIEIALKQFINILFT